MLLYWCNYGSHCVFVYMVRGNIYIKGKKMENSFEIVICEPGEILYYDKFMPVRLSDSSDGKPRYLVGRKEHG